MKKTLLTILSLMFINCVSNSQIINREPLSPRITGYRIEAKLNTESQTVVGYMEAFWVNYSSDMVRDVQLHMYMNAFKSNKTTLYSEINSKASLKETEKGRIDIQTFTAADGANLLPSAQYFSPDDGNLHDSTVIQVILPQAVKPGDTVSIKVNFETKLPSRIRRTGYADDYYFIAQWFPKFGVYETTGMRYRMTSGWNCHQFHAHSEFYANHSVYDVKITVPNEYIVGTGGLLLDETDSGDGEKTLTYRAEDIPDFAWTAWPGYKVFTEQWEHVKITLLIPGERLEQVERQFTAVKNALEYLTKNVGPYPWPHLTFVDPPAKGSGAGGMEYTTIFTSASFFKIPVCFHVPEMVTVHEFGHAYFMGILASNEFEEPWMDEGINSFWEERIMDHYWGENSGMIDNPLLRISDKSISRISYVSSGSRQVVSNNEYSWNYPHHTYSMMSYQKTATWLYTLMGIIGEETTNEIFREYYRRWAFKHPSGKDFINVVNDIVRNTHGDEFGPDMNWFFDQTLYGTGICDYKVSDLHNIKLESALKDSTLVDTLKKNLPAHDTLYKAVACIERAGEVMLPVDVLIHFTNGDEVLESWDGKARYKDFVYTGKRMIEWIKVDPEYKIRMDVNFINNSMTQDPNRIPLRRFTNKIISLMQFFVSAFTL
ncbi:MAG: M1 family metallopeptidase [Bacteroidales bacterium]|nr:M1 family metallopeptidase [Bacteroidales bacterium]